MKHGKRPTKAQKIRMKGCGLNPDNWLVITDHNGVFLVVNRVSGKAKSLKKEA
jgi:hypothetical protein